MGGDGGPATSAGLNFPVGLALDANGNLFIADLNNNRIRRVDVNTHVITTVAGSEDPFIGDYAGDGGLATLARLNQPYAVAVDANGNLFISDSANNVIRRVDASTQIITTYAGNGLPGTPGAANGDGGPATSAQFNQPFGIAVDGNANLFIADSNDSVVRRVDGQTQIITTFAGSPAKQGTFSGDGGAATAAGMSTVIGVFMDTTGNLYISDTGNERVRFVDNSANHIISTIAGNGTLCANPATACGDGAAATSASLNHPAGVFLDNNGNLLISDSGNQRIRIVAGGNISAFAGGATGGDGGPATSAILGLPNSVVVDSSGNLFIMEQYGERVRRVDKTTHNISTYAGTGARGERNQPNGDGALAVNANFVDAFGVAIDGPGNIYVVDFRASVVRKIDATTKIISTVAGNGKRCGEPGNANTTSNNCGDGGLATSASLLQPGGVTVDSLGNIYVSDLALNRVRIVNGQGIISNYAGTGTAGYSGDGGDPLQATMNGPFGMAADAQGNLFVADSNNNVIREIGAPPDGSISTYAFNGLPGFSGDGGPAVEASMWAAFQVALDDRGNLYIGGGQDNVVRRVDKQDSSIITVAGDIENLAGGFSGDGGPSTKALIGNLGLTIDASHNLYIADGLQRVRKVNLLPVATEFGSFTPFPPTLSGTDIFSAPSQDIEFSNSGLDDLVLTITSPVQPSSFQLGTTCTPTGTAPVPCTIIVPPGESGSVDVIFAPPAGIAGPIAGTLAISTNDPANPSFSFPLSGTATNTSFALNVTVTPDADGFVSSTPSGIFCGVSPSEVCSANFAQNLQVTLSASPAATGFAFMGWSGAGCSGTADCVVTMSQAQNVTATFSASTPGTTPTVVSAFGNGSGTITSNPAGINCVYNGTATSGTCSFTFPAATFLVTLTATPSVPGSTFAGWLGFCSVLGTDTCQTIAGIGLTTTAVFSVPPQAFTQGEVLAGASGGMIFVYKPDGTLAQVLGSGNIGGNIGGIAFDTTGNLYAANPTANIQSNDVGTVERFGSNGSGPTTFGTGPFGNGYDSNPQSVVVAPTGRVYVAQSAGRGSLLRFPPAGGVAAAEFFPPTDTGSMQWIELLDDNNTILYTTAGSIVKAFDVHDNIFLPDFAQNLPGPAALGLRELADKSVLVADGDRIVRLNTSGAVIQTYQAGTGVYHSLNLDPDGVSFWTLEDVQGTMFRINITTGAIIKQFSTGVGDTLNAFNGFEGGLAVFGQPQSGGADMQVTMSAAPNPVVLNSNVTYTITVTNNGVLDAANVAMTDAFPVGASFVSAATSVGTCTGTATVTCNLGTVANGATATITIVVTATQAGTLVNTVNVTSTTPDPITSDNSATTSTTISGPTATHFSVTAPATATNGTAFNFTVTALDATNATVTGYTGTVHFTSTDAQAVLPANATITNGTGTFSATLKTNGVQTITATDTVTAAITGTSGAITVSTPAAATHFSVSAPGTATAGTAFNFTVTALDATNATVTGYAGTVHFTSTDGQAVLPANATLSNGVGTFSATLKTNGSQSITATDTVTSSISGTSATILIGGAAPATHFSVTAPGTATSGTAFNVSVTALDASNAVATGYTGTVHFTSTDGQAVLPANSTLANGVGTFSVTLKTIGSQTVTATDTVTPSITGTTGAVTVGAAAATHFTVSAPATATNGTALNFTVTALDQSNNTATGYAGTVHFTSTDGQAVLPANATLTNGTGTFAATLKTNGAQTITATDIVTASITGTSGTITVSAAAATHFTVAAPATATTGAAFNFTVTALTAANATATGYAGAAHFTSSDGNAILPANSTLTNGVGTFSATLNSVGGQTITATDTETSSITGTSGTITVSAIAAPQLTVQTLGTGTGTVTGAGINCTSGSANGCTTGVTAGTQVTLTAAAATGSTFTSWNTACPNLTSTTCAFTMPATAQIVTATFTLNAPTLQSIAVTPANPTEPINSTLQFHATGTFSDGSTKDLTNTVEWQSTNPEAATINEMGLATTGSAADETTTISASQSDVTGSTLLTVSNSPITISVTPPPGGSYPPVPPGGQLAIGIVLTSASGFTGTVTFGCTTDSPTITCQPNPASVAISPGGPTQVAIVLNTFCTGNTSAARAIWARPR